MPTLEASLELVGPQRISFESVIAEYGGMIARIAETYEAVPARREELVQEISLALWRALPRYRAEASMKTFVARVAHNRSITHVARETRDPKGEPLSPAQVDESETPEEQAGRSGRREALLSAIRALPLLQRQVVALMLEDLSHREIADILGLNVNAVAIRLTRARKQLKKIMGVEA